ncbi:DUF1269 domain-containing protein [Paraburkholderia bengalensis]|uniref:DUF1269 domain-containing protein n=1 Tax=Paraburkholderia bengalensis TaxID=2747562 RepID=A0ABU8J5A8_9BURK
MTNFIFALFPDDASARAGLEVFESLHLGGDITLFSYAIVRRGADGIPIVLERKTAPIGSRVGALMGGTAGLFGGLAGVGIGAAAGGIIGAVLDIFNLGMSKEFLDSICKELVPGKTAVFAEVSEELTRLVDTRIQACGGRVLREARDDFLEDAIRKRIVRLKGEVEALRAGYAVRRTEKVLQALHEAVTRSEGKLQKAAVDAARHIEQYRAESSAKLDMLHQQLQSAAPETRARIEQRMIDLQTDQKQRLAKLQEALDFAKEAMRA